MGATKSETKPEKKNKGKARSEIKEQVLALLGKPKDLYCVDVCLYQSRRARVNIWRREMAPAQTKGGIMGAMGKPELIEITHITDSHYLCLSETAIIESANPPIERKY